ncbi:MAG: sigma 54-interacting transcriptional regulator, partial [Actinomycetota bacterium]|nr:sigma 54-interacting transcriptional regulator [Actinomycetota bacterium]
MQPGVVVTAGGGDELVDAVARHHDAGRPVLVVDAKGDPDPRQVWALLAAGAADVVRWQDESTADLVAARLERWLEIERLVQSPAVRATVVGRSRPWMAVLRRLVEVARFTSSPLLLTGESGTGKELAAGLVHTLDQRSPKGRLVVVDCTTVVPSLSGSEFFGHERGAFTGAVQARDGAVGLADGGTLFLDEVGELPLQLQAELLRVIQEGTYKRVGSSRWERSSFRLVCATNRDLEVECDEGRFRRDLYYRIAGVVVALPPLRERRDDVLHLFRAFLRQLLPGDTTPELTPEVAAYVQHRPYHGNVRELRQLAARVALRHVGPGPITPGDLPDDDRPDADSVELWDRAGLGAAVRTAVAAGVTLHEIERVAGDLAVEAALADSANRVSDAAARLGISDRAVHYRLKARA